MLDRAQPVGERSTEGIGDLVVASGAKGGSRGPLNGMAVCQDVPVYMFKG